MSRKWSILAVALFVGAAWIGLSQYGLPLLKQYRKYYDLSQYRGAKDYKLPVPPPGGLPNFGLVDLEGNGVELYRMSGARAIVVISHIIDCPILAQYTRSIVAIKKEYENRNVEFVFLNSNHDNEKQKVADWYNQFPANIPVLLDSSQAVTKQFGFSRSAEVALVDPKTWQIVYRGAIDDSLTYGGGIPEARNLYLQNALEDYLHGRPVRQMEGRQVMGCAITYRKEDHPLTYVRDAGPIFANKCLNCHSPAVQTRPTLADYNGVKNWTAMIKDVIVSRRMPPWGWDMTVKQPYNHKRNLTHLTGDEIRILVDWIDAGAPRGEGPDPQVERTTLWLKEGSYKKRNKLPDVEFANREIEVPPKGYNEYKFYQIGGPTEKDMWVVGTNLRSSNLQTIHHQMLIATKEPLSAFEKRVRDRRDQDLIQEDDTGNVPAWDLHQMRADSYEDTSFVRIQISGLGMPQPAIFDSTWDKRLGFFIAKGSYLILETHYHGTGVPEKETSTVGLYLAKDPKGISHIISGRVSFINKVEIPPNTLGTKVIADPVILPKKSGLLALGIHIHMRGRSAKYYARYPDGKEELLASHPFFNYNTSTARGLSFMSSKILPAGTKVRIECVYDNTASNPFNPNPNVPVHWGQTVDRSEMCMGYLWTYDVDEKNSKAPLTHGQQK